MTRSERDKMERDVTRPNPEKVERGERVAKGCASFGRDGALTPRTISLMRDVEGSAGGKRGRMSIGFGRVALKAFPTFSVPSLVPRGVFYE